MFDYDRELNIAQQLAVNVDTVNGKKTTNRPSTDDSLPFLGPLDNALSLEEKTDDNAIVHGLEGLLRRCSSPNNGFHQLGQFRQKSASVGSDHLYSTQFLSKRPPHHLFDGLKNSFASNGTSLDMQNTFRRLSGGSAGTLADTYECDTSSGYGSLLGTPLASPAMSSAQFHAAQLQKMFMDPGISEEEEIALDKQDTALTCHRHHKRFRPCKGVEWQQCRRLVAKAPAPPHPTLLMTNTTMAHNNGSTATLLKATTTTTGTNKNSNKRKTSLNTTVGQNSNNNANTNNGGGASITTGPPPAEQIVPTEDGFDFREIKGKVIKKSPGHKILNGNLNDYAWGEHGLDNVLTALLNQFDGAQQPTRLTPEDIAKLPMCKVVQKQVDNGTQCTTCMETFVLDETVGKLDCGHIFHPDCLKPWLQRNNTCPICRKEIDPSKWVDPILDVDELD
uniref:RING-type domain-containing protein n=1 Tax=Globodera pallida TaxID=36090 RepID=A0A183CL68_GLOPA